ncbi:MAG: hypothetical protein PWP43_936 [Bacillota bacterium]|nr:hypothetical protein [Bacillota bacterium]
MYLAVAAGLFLTAAQSGRPVLGAAGTAGRAQGAPETGRGNLQEGRGLPDATGVLLAATGETAGLCPAKALVLALGGQVRASAEGELVARLPGGELRLAAGEQRALYGGHQYVLASSPVAGEDGLYLAAPELARLLNLEVRQQVEEALFFAPGGKEEARLLEARTYADGPAWYLVGRVRNAGKRAQELVRVSWEVGNSAGEVVSSTAGYINHLNQGEAKAFKLLAPLRGDAAWYRIDTAAGFPGRPRELQLTATAKRYNDRPASYLSLLGRVQSTGRAGYDFLKVVVEFYDACGRLVDVDSAFINCLDPGTSASFTVYTPRLEATSWQIRFD